MSGTALAPRPRHRPPGARFTPPDRETAIVLVGGPRLLRAAVGGLIDSQPRMRVSSSQSSIEALEEACALAPPRCDVALVDVDDYRGECLTAVDRVLTLELRCKLVLLCAEVTSEIVLAATSRRVDGVVLKQSSIGELCEAIEHILTGHAVMPASWGAAPELVALTPRQAEVLRLISRGFSNEEIGGELGVRPNTVKFHISEIFRRLGVRNRIEAIAQLDSVDGAAPR